MKLQDLNRSFAKVLAAVAIAFMLLRSTGWPVGAPGVCSVIRWKSVLSRPGDH